MIYFQILLDSKGICQFAMCVCVCVCVKRESVKKKERKMKVKAKKCFFVVDQLNFKLMKNNQIYFNNLLQQTLTWIFQGILYNIYTTIPYPRFQLKKLLIVNQNKLFHFLKYLDNQNHG